MQEELSDRKEDNMSQLQEELTRDDPIACNLDFLIEGAAAKENSSKGKTSSKHFINSRALFGEIKPNFVENIENGEKNKLTPIKAENSKRKHKKNLQENELIRKVNSSETESSVLQAEPKDLKLPSQSTKAQSNEDDVLMDQKKIQLEENRKGISKRDKSRKNRDKKANNQKTWNNNHHSANQNKSGMEPGELDLSELLSEMQDFKAPKPQQTVSKEGIVQSNGKQSSVEISSLVGLDKAIVKNKSDLNAKSSNNSMDNSQSSSNQVVGAIQESNQRNVKETPSRRPDNVHPRNSDKWNRSKRKKKKGYQNLIESLQQETPSIQVEEGYQPSEPMKKLLDMPLNVLQNLETKSERNSERAGHFGSRSQNYSFSANSSNALNYHSKPSLTLNLSIPYSERCYSDRLQLEEQYLENKLTPISKTFQDSMLTASELQNSIQESLLNFENSLKEAKLNFLRFQSGTGLKFFPSGTDLKVLQTAEKKEVLKVTPERALRLFQTPSTNSPNISGTDTKEVHLLYSDSTRSSNSLRKLDQEDTLEIKLYESLQTVFELPNFEPDQISAIKTILNKQSCLFRYVKQMAKINCLQTLGNFNKGICCLC